MQIQQYHYLPKTKSISCMQVRRAEDYRVKAYHMHDHQELVLVDSSCTCRVVNNGSRAQVRGPMILVNRAGTFHEVETVLEGEYHSRVVFFHPQNLQDLPESLQYRRLFESDMLLLQLDEEQLSRFLPFYELLENSSLEQQRLLVLCILSQMELLLRQGVQPVITNAHHTYIFDVIEQLQATSEPCTAGELAERFHVSKSKLWVDFRQITGVSLAVFSHRVRLQKAKSLLETTNLKIAQIAQKCGFSDESYFIGSFRRTYGVTPGAYRRGR